MATIECAGCNATVDESEATSIAEHYGITSVRADARFCEECMDDIGSEPNFPFVL